MTPLVGIRPGVMLKMEQVSPTGSFKDRGAALLLALALGAGETSVVCDSSGNAGRSVAAYAARAGLGAEIFVPAGTAETKTAVAREHGARVVVVDGDRESAALTAQRRVLSGGGWYASHVHQAAFVHAVKTAAFEIFEQLGGRSPGSVVVPAGNGSLVQGMWLGFSVLAATRGSPMPAIVAVQSDRFAVLAGSPPTGESTVAAGIAIARPSRAGQVRAAVVASGGCVIAVNDEQIVAAADDLAANGVRVEPTGATGWAGLTSLGSPPEPVVVVLTGR